MSTPKCTGVGFTKWTSRQIGCEIAFISLNGKDFSGEDKQLHSHLRADIHIDGFPKDKVKLFLKVDQFLDQHVIPSLPPAEQTIANLMQSAPKGFNLADAVAEALSEPLPGTEVSADSLGKSSEIESVDIDSVHDVTNLTFSQEAEISKGEVVLEMTATVDCEFTGFVFKSDYYLFDEKDAPFIWDADWNEHYYAVSFMAQVSVRAYLTRIIHESETRSWDSLVTSYNRTCHRM